MRCSINAIAYAKTLTRCGCVLEACTEARRTVYITEVWNDSGDETVCDKVMCGPEEVHTPRSIM